MDVPNVRYGRKGRSNCGRKALPCMDGHIGTEILNPWNQ